MSFIRYQAKLNTTCLHIPHLIKEVQKHSALPNPFNLANPGVYSASHSHIHSCNMFRLVTITAMIVFALVSRTVATYVAPPHTACYSKCVFSFCDKSTVLKVSATTDNEVTAPICKGYSDNIGVVGETGEALRYYSGYFTPISKWHPEGLEQYFSSSFFKAFSFGYYSKYLGHSGVGCEVAQQNQLDFLDGECWVLPINAYQVLDKNGTVIDNVHRAGKDPYTQCIAFKTVVY